VRKYLFGEWALIIVAWAGWIDLCLFCVPHLSPSPEIVFYAVFASSPAWGGG
jgi:hypothetical protein